MASHQNSPSPSLAPPSQEIVEIVELLEDTWNIPDIGTYFEELVSPESSSDPLFWDRDLLEALREISRLTTDVSKVRELIREAIHSRIDSEKANDAEYGMMPVDLDMVRERLNPGTEPEIERSHLRATSKNKAKEDLDFVAMTWRLSTWDEILPDDMKPSVSPDDPSSWPSGVILALTTIAAHDSEADIGKIHEQIRAVVNNRLKKNKRGGRAYQRHLGVTVADLDTVAAAMRRIQRQKTKDASVPRRANEETNEAGKASPVASEDIIEEQDYSAPDPDGPGLLEEQDYSTSNPDGPGLLEETSNPFSPDSPGHRSQVSVDSLRDTPNRQWSTGTDDRRRPSSEQSTIIASPHAHGNFGPRRPDYAENSIVQFIEEEITVNEVNALNSAASSDEERMTEGPRKRRHHSEDNNDVIADISEPRYPGPPSKRLRTASQESRGRTSSMVSSRRTRRSANPSPSSNAGRSVDSGRDNNVRNAENHQQQELMLVPTDEEIMHVEDGLEILPLGAWNAMPDNPTPAQQMELLDMHIEAADLREERTDAACQMEIERNRVLARKAKARMHEQRRRRNVAFARENRIRLLARRRALEMQEENRS